MKIDRALLHKYDRPGPRYTSYPTAPEWSAEFGPADYRAALNRAAKMAEPLSLYIHIPFCRKRCFYCGCNTSVDHGQDTVERYLEILKKELQLVSGNLASRNKLNQIHWGGGTPTHLNLSQIENLFSAIRDNFIISEDAEIAIEVDPRVTSPEHIQLLRRLGFNRISLGVQDLTPRVQEAIGRRQSQEQTEELFRLCRRKKFDSINVDLIYGLPLQTVSDFSATIDEIIKMGVDRIAVYSFAFLPERLKHQKNINPIQLPDVKLKFELFATAIEKFTSAGYVQIGMDHFARPEDDLAKAVGNGRLYRNFMGYTSKRAGDAIGIGMSAIGEIGGAFAQNYSDLNKYMEKIESGDNAVYRGIKLTRDDAIRQYVILSLMCNLSLSYERLKDKFDIEFEEYFKTELVPLTELAGDGLLTIGKKGLQVEEPGRLLVRNIAMVFDAYLNKPGRDKVQFSRTV